MIKHIVMWNVSGDTPEQKRHAAIMIKTKFESLIGQIPGLKTIEVGLDISRIPYACDVVLYSEFEDEAALRCYAEHPAHAKVRADLEGIRIARHQVDYVC
ncbi:hypothetical protein GGQ73_000157 [Rhizobium skierniewicense]|uniref:Stress-response A/B barrel domain-containing protein n=1 Tax=Rhizobium skierniewicense TaxID=984260 RepID=A0A7W6C7F4_9HYPH|nr:Dabb family protein [Rhizobium skierniewicense]MBB3944234.1 hypothetical protein [Rhizobium skierniewicense]NTF33834.1 Dabb family protein [Rhizobium skierniewicense]